MNFRAHHFLCTLCFQGKGYSPAFIANYELIADQLKKNPLQKIHVVDQTDSICEPCPHKKGARCDSQEKISQLDQAHAAVLNIQVNDDLTWTEAKQRITENLTLEKFHEICALCQWKTLGICESVIRETLNASDKENTL